MRIKTDDRLKKKYKGFPRLVSDVTEITIHGTGGGTARGIINWMCSDTCERIPNYKRGIGLFPYEIDRDGMVYNIMPVEDWYYHSEAGAADKHTIGIELVNPELLNAGAYTQEQYDSLFELIQELMVLYPIHEITSHDHNRKKYSGLGRKPCPGQFDIGSLELFRTENQYSWKIAM